MSSKNGDTIVSTDLWTRKSIRSDDRIIRLASGTLKGSSGGMGELIWAWGSSRSPTRDRADSVCKEVQHI